MSRVEQRDGWISLLSGYTWDWFTSQTFRLPIHPEAADKVFRTWISMINRSLWGPRWYKKKKSVYWVRALEWQKRDVLHFHALLSHPTGNLNDYCNRLFWMDRWDQLAGYARISKPDSSEAVTRYVTKYILKDGDIELSPFLPMPIQTQRQLGQSPSVRSQFEHVDHDKNCRCPVCDAEQHLQPIPAV